MIFRLMLSGWIAADLIWWYAAYRRLHRAPARRFWRCSVGAFMCLQLAYLLGQLIGPLVGHVPDFRPMLWPIAVYVWHLLVLPAAILELSFSTIGRWALALRNRWKQCKHPHSSFSLSRPAVSAVEPYSGGGLGWGPSLQIRGNTAPTLPSPGVPGEGETREILPSVMALATSPSPNHLTRREAIRGAAALLPPLATLGITGRAAAQLNGFRVQRIDLHLPTLPHDLDGVTIAHVTDLHIGRFLPSGMADRVADATNALEPDLVAFTGDLIDLSAPLVRPGIDFIRRLRPKSGLVMIEGNHDVMPDADRFEGEVLSAGLPLLLDQAKTIQLPGRRTPLQFLGATWGDSKIGRDIGRTGGDALLRFRVHSDEATAASIQKLAALRQADAFPILLAHHPHAFDNAATAGFPLVLAGHTHGGQIMLTQHFGAGSVRFHYWTGLYQKPHSQLFIANGIGNWFPLRLNAPAEIVHLTLRSGSPPSQG